MAHGDWLEIFINWFPMLLLIAVWLFLLRKMGGKGYMTQDQRDHMAMTERQVVALEKIAKALDRQAS